MMRLEEAFYTWSCKEQSNEKFQKLSSIRDPLIFELKREKKSIALSDPSGDCPSSLPEAFL